MENFGEISLIFAPDLGISLPIFFCRYFCARVFVNLCIDYWMILLDYFTLNGS